MGELRIQRVGEKWWDDHHNCWKDNHGGLTSAPTTDEIRTANIDNTFNQLTVLLPELRGVLDSYKTQTISAFISILLDRATAAGAVDEVVKQARELIATVLTIKAAELERNDHFTHGYTIKSKIEEIVDQEVRRLVQQELTKRLSKSDLLKAAIDKALKSEALIAEANNIITPKLVELVKELRLELTAGSKSRY